MNKKIITIGLSLIFLILLFSPHEQSIQQSVNTSAINRIHLERVDGRYFLWIQPNVPLPDQGFPVIFLFHGASQHMCSWLTSWNQWNRNQKSFTQTALDNGFFLIILESKRPFRPGPRAWDVFTVNEDENNDIHYVKNVIHWLETKESIVDTNHVFCTGFSSGAFMCSRLALSTHDLFKAIAINSGCNADRIELTRTGPVFNLSRPVNISKNHPPTLILHGEKDRLVPVSCGITYHEDLQQKGISSTLLIHPEQGHIWLQTYNKHIIQWFQNYCEKQ